jgi:hypothetical protein
MIEVPANNRDRCMALADQITELRKEILAMETYARTGIVQFSQQARLKKRQLKALAVERQSPDVGVSAWYQPMLRRGGSSGNDVLIPPLSPHRRMQSLTTEESFSLKPSHPPNGFSHTNKGRIGKESCPGCV